MNFDTEPFRSVIIARQARINRAVPTVTPCPAEANAQAERQCSGKTLSRLLPSWSDRLQTIQKSITDTSARARVACMRAAPAWIRS